jgi:rhodanese-related sulfurtransferase
MPRMTKEQAKAMLGNPDVVILDCRPAEQWRFSDQKIPGAVHEDPMDVESWAGKYSKDKTIVIY